MRRSNACRDRVHVASSVRVHCALHARVGTMSGGLNGSTESEARPSSSQGTISRRRGSSCAIAASVFPPSRPSAASRAASSIAGIGLHALRAYEYGVSCRSTEQMAKSVLLRTDGPTFQAILRCFRPYQNVGFLCHIFIDTLYTHVLISSCDLLDHRPF